MSPLPESSAPPLQAAWTGINTGEETYPTLVSSFPSTVSLALQPPRFFPQNVLDKNPNQFHEKENKLGFPDTQEEKGGTENWVMELS